MLVLEAHVAELGVPTEHHRLVHYLTTCRSLNFVQKYCFPISGTYKHLVLIQF